MVAKQSREERLAESNDMTPVAGTVDVNIPVDELWETFRKANLWSRWNRCFFWALNKDLVLGKQLIWAFEPIRWWYLYKMPAVAKIVELEPGSKVTWEVTALPGFYARHTYHMESLGEGRSRFGSWEKATGWGFRLTKRFWLAHFVFVKDESLAGARRLEELYAREASADAEKLPKRRMWPFALATAVVTAALVAGLWFYNTYVRQSEVEIADGVYAVFGGGGNSLVVHDQDDVLVVDTKFPPGSLGLRRWIRGHIDEDVTHVVNTHYHYDHTQGNELYEPAAIYSHRRARELMMLRDGTWWNDHESGLPQPNHLVDGTQTLRIGRKEVQLIHPGRAHTEGDLVVYVADDNVIATGDIVFHTFHPFFDRGTGGVSIPELIETVRGLAETYPDATFVPGHGPVARAEDLNHFADYLTYLYDAVGNAIAAGKSEDEAVAQIDLSEWELGFLPIKFEGGRLILATATSNVRWAYRLAQAAGTSEGGDRTDGSMRDRNF